MLIFFANQSTADSVARGVFLRRWLSLGLANIYDEKGIIMGEIARPSAINSRNSAIG